jgi:hypothetical protein
MFDYFVEVMYELFIEKIKTKDLFFKILHFDVETGETGIC